MTKPMRWQEITKGAKDPGLSSEYVGLWEFKKSLRSQEEIKGSHSGTGVREPWGKALGLHPGLT